MNKKNMLYRTKLFDRLCHAVLVTCFLLVALSGLGMFFPSMHIFTYVLGTPQLARIIHPILGCVMFFILCIMLFRFGKHNMLNKNDIVWFKNVQHISLGGHGEGGNEDKPLPIGKYNAGQKMLFWGIIMFVIILFSSGLLIWHRYFSGLFPITVVRIALLVHSVTAIAFMLWILGHAYMAFWVKGTLQSMITGYIPKRWAKKHHPLWYKEMTEKQQEQHK